MRATLFVLEHPEGARGAVRTMIQYAVEGLPPNRHALIGKKDGRWQILRVKDGVVGHWEGDYPTAQAALSAMDVLEHRDVPAAQASIARADRLAFRPVRSAGCEN